MIAASLPVLLLLAATAAAGAPTTLEGDQARQSPQAAAFTRCMEAQKSGSPRALRGSFSRHTVPRIEFTLQSAGKDELTALMAKTADAALAGTVSRVVVDGETATVHVDPPAGGAPVAPVEVVLEDGRWLCKTFPK